MELTCEYTRYFPNPSCDRVRHLSMEEARKSSVSLDSDYCVLQYYSVLRLLYESVESRTETIVVNVASSLSTLSLPWIGVQNNTQQLCFSGAQPITLHLARFFLPLALVFLFFMAYVFYRFSARLLHKKTLRNQQQKFISGLFSILLLCYSSIAGAVFAFVLCVHLPIVNHTNVETVVRLEWRLLQHAEWTCWWEDGGIAVLLFFGLLLVFAVPVGLFVWQGMLPSKNHHRPLERCRPRSWQGVTALAILEGKLRIWYWDVVLFARRAILE